MKILAIALVLVAVIAVSAAVYLKHRLDRPPDNKDLEATLDAELKKFSATALSHGVVIGIYREGKSFIKGYGAASKDGAAVPDASTIFQLASVSKLLTASTLQILCDEGVLGMEATLGELIGGAGALSPAARQVTLRQLASHTAGFPKDPKPFVLKASKLAGTENLLQNPFSYLELKDVFDYLETTDDMHEPGRFEYSNFGMGLLGHVMEIVTKKDLESLVTEKLLTPLGMSNTAIVLTPQMKQHLAQGHTDTGETSPLWTFGALAGAGAFNSDVDDMLKFIRANIEDVSPMSPVLRKTHAPQFGGDAGIGWMQPTFFDRLFGNRSVVWHNGMVGGYASYLSIDTKAKTGVVVLSGKALDVTMLGMMLTRQARTQSWAARPAR